MKSFLFVIALSFSISSVFACQQEAQFIGKVTHIVDSGETCQLFLDFQYYRPSMVCALEKSDVSYYGVTVHQANCPYQLDQVLSGVLVKKLDEIHLD